MTVFAKDFDVRSGSRVTAYKAGDTCPDDLIERAQAKGVLEDDNGSDGKTGAKGRAIKVEG